jgi:WD40 repeat protein
LYLAVITPIPTLLAKTATSLLALTRNFHQELDFILAPRHGNFQASLKLWDLAGNCLQTFTGHTYEVRSANFSLDGKQIVSASGGQSVYHLG